MADTPYKGETKVKRKDTGEVVTLTGEGFWDPNAFTLVSGNSPSNPALRYPSDPASEYYGGLDITPPTADEESTIRETERRNIQSYIDLIDAQYAKEVAGEEEAGKQRYGRTRALLSASGTLGTPMGASAKEQTTEYTKEQMRLLNEEKTAQVNILLDRADQNALDRIEKERTLAKTNSEAYLTYLQGVKEESRTNLAALAQSGVSLENLKNSTDENGKSYYDVMKEQTGWDNFVFDSMYNLNLAKEAQETKIYSEVTKDGKLTVMWQSPDGKVRTEKYDWDQPDVEAGWSVDIAPNGMMYKWNKEGKVEFIGGGYGKATEADIEEDAKGLIINWFNSGIDPDTNGPIIGKDGMVSPTNWKRAKNAWRDDLLDPMDFIKQFYSYINPKYAQEYGQKEADYVKAGGGSGVQINIVKDEKDK